MKAAASKRGQAQNHGPRAPRGSAVLVHRVAFWCTAKQRRWIERHGGSIAMRKLIDEASK